MENQRLKNKIESFNIFEKVGYSITYDVFKGTEFNNNILVIPISSYEIEFEVEDTRQLITKDIVIYVKSDAEDTFHIEAEKKINELCQELYFTFSKDKEFVLDDYKVVYNAESNGNNLIAMYITISYYIEICNKKYKK